MSNGLFHGTILSSTITKPNILINNALAEQEQKQETRAKEQQDSAPLFNDNDCSSKEYFNFFYNMCLLKKSKIVKMALIMMVIYMQIQMIQIVLDNKK